MEKMPVSYAHFTKLLSDSVHFRVVQRQDSFVQALFGKIEELREITFSLYLSRSIISIDAPINTTYDNEMIKVINVASCINQ